MRPQVKSTGVTTSKTRSGAKSGASRRERAPFEARKKDEESFDPSRLSNAIPKFSSSPCLMAKTKVLERRELGLQVFDFGLGESKGDLKDSLKEAGKLAFEEERSGYVHPGGIKELREEALRWLGLEDKYDFENVCVAVGAKQALYNIYVSTCNPGDTVLFDVAPWVSYRPMVFCTSAVPLQVQPSRGFEGNLKITVEDVERVLKGSPNVKSLLINSPCNPTGQVYTKDEIDELLEFCASKRIFFILDRLYWKSMFDGVEYPEPTINEFTKPWLIQIDGLSKNWRNCGGLRVGWAVGLDVGRAVGAGDTADGLGVEGAGVGRGFGFGVGAGARM